MKTGKTIIVSGASVLGATALVFLGASVGSKVIDTPHLLPDALSGYFGSEGDDENVWLASVFGRPDVAVTDVTSTGDASDPVEEEVVTGSPEENLAKKLVQDARTELGLPDPDDSDAIIQASLEVGYKPSPDRYEVFLQSRPAIEVEGEAVARSSSNIEVDDILITLRGVRSPEEGSICVSKSGTSFDCAFWSRQALQAALDANPVKCEIRMHFGDRNQAIGTCDFRMPDGSGLDVGTWLAAAGVAFADRTSDINHVPDEARARAAGAGLWSGDPGF